MPSKHPMLAMDAPAEAEAKWLTEALLGHQHPDCDTFRKLEGALSYQMAIKIRANGIVPHVHPPHITPDLTSRRANTMYELLRTISLGSEHPYGFSHRTVRFLDVGSKYDGFSRYVLDNSNGSGVRVFLPVDEREDNWGIPLSDRHEEYPVDLLTLVASYMSSDPTTHPLPAPLNKKFDFVILNADSSCPRVILAQLLLALYTIYNGGQILLTLSCIERPLTARVVIAISKIADYVTTSKPARIHARSGLFYLHAQAVRTNTPAYRKLKDNLERLWYRIHSTHTRNPTWDEQDLITPWEEVMKKSNVNLIIELGKPLWETQLTALHRAFN
ncbi:FtsJ-like methyltransferase, partial [Rhizoctonia solani]